jgi:hypothetical protein
MGFETTSNHTNLFGSEPAGLQGFKERGKA